MKRKIVLFLSFTMFVLGSGICRADDFPTRTITIIDPLPAGGMLDLLGRTFAGVAEKYLGQPVVVMNKVGAGGAVGSVAATQAKPDGYTLCMGWSAQTNLIVGEVLAGRKPSFTIDDFIPIGLFTNSPPIFLVPYNSPWKTIQQALKDIKANPNKFKFGSGGVYQISHLPVELLMAEAGLSMRHVPFQGGGPTFIALIGEHVDCAALFPGVSLPKMRAKQIRALAQFGEERVKNYEEYPTFKEVGYDVVYTSWMGLLAPKGTPGPVIAKLKEVHQRVVNDPSFKNAIEKTGDQVVGLGAEKMGDLWKREYKVVYKLMERLLSSGKK